MGGRKEKEPASEKKNQSINFIQKIVMLVSDESLRNGSDSPLKNMSKTKKDDYLEHFNSKFLREALFKLLNSSLLKHSFYVSLHEEVFEVVRNCFIAIINSKPSSVLSFNKSRLNARENTGAWDDPLFDSFQQSLLQENWRPRQEIHGLHPFHFLHLERHRDLG